MDILGKLFSSTALVKIMRLFLLNPDTPFENNDIMEKSKVTRSSLRTEMSILQSIKFVKKKTFYKEIPKKTKNGKPKKKKVSGWCLNHGFEYLAPLKVLLVNTASVDHKDIVNKFKNTGKIKLIVLSGIFIKESTGHVDMLVVGDNIKKNALERVLRSIESEIGKELVYAAIDTKEFNYRLNMYDKFIRDIFDYPHTKVIDKIGV